MGLGSGSRPLCLSLRRERKVIFLPRNQSHKGDRADKTGSCSQEEENKTLALYTMVLQGKCATDFNYFPFGRLEGKGEKGGHWRSDTCEDGTKTKTKTKTKTHTKPKTVIKTKNQTETKTKDKVYNVALYCVMIYCVAWCCIVLCCVAIPCLVLSCLSCLVLYRLLLPCLVSLCLVVSGLVLSAVV